MLKNCTCHTIFEPCKWVHIQGDSHLEKCAVIQQLQEACTHGIVFDALTCELENLTVYEVRKRFPRFHGTCNQCGFTGIAYANRMHYYWGDW